MNKGIIILCTLIVLVSLMCFFKENKYEDKKEINKYQNYNFYKEENLERYKKYQEKYRLDIKNSILRVNIGLDHSFYTNTKEIINSSVSMLVNKYNYVSKNFKPTNLVKVLEFSKNNMYLQKECMEAFIKMASSAFKEGLNLRAISTYRTYDYQEKLYQNYVKTDGIKKADTYSARPGFSEHHTGLAIDLDNIKTSYTNFSCSKEFIWMQKNSHKYGFILRYPENKEHITGYMYEAWHYRYVGVEIATYIKNNNITFEEYYYEFIEKTK